MGAAEIDRRAGDELVDEEAEPDSADDGRGLVE